MPAGLSIAEIVELIQPDPVLRAHGVAFIGEHSVARDRWHRVRPKAGALLSIRLLPSGSGARIAAMIGIAVLAIALAVAAPYLTPLIAEGGGERDGRRGDLRRRERRDRARRHPGRQLRAAAAGAAALQESRPRPA